MAELEKLVQDTSDLKSVFLQFPGILDMLLYIVKYNDGGHVEVDTLLEKFGKDVAIQNMAELRKFNLIRIFNGKVFITDEGLFQVETLFEL